MGLMDWTGRSHREREDSLHAIYQMELARAHDPETDPRDRAQAMANAELAAQQIFPGALGHQTQPPKQRTGLIGHIQNLLMGPPQQGAGLQQGMGSTPPSAGQQGPTPGPASPNAPNVDQTPNMQAAMDDPNENGMMASMGGIVTPPPRGAASPLDNTPPAPALPVSAPPPQTGAPVGPASGAPMNRAARSLPAPAPLQQPALQPPNEEGVYSAQGPMGQIRTLSPAKIAAMKAEAENASLNTAMTGNLQRMNRLQNDPVAQKLQAGQQAQMATGGKVGAGQKLSPMVDKPQSGANLIQHFQTDMQGNPTDPNQQYVIHRDPMTGNTIGIEQTATRGLMGPLQSDGQNFSKPILDPSTGNVRSQVATVPPPAYATRTTKTSGSHEQAIRQPDGSIRVVNMGRGATSTRSVQVPPTSGGPTPSMSRGAGGGTTTPPSTPARGGKAGGGGGVGRVVGGAPPSDREKLSMQNIQEGLHLGQEIQSMIHAIPAEDRHTGPVDSIVQAAKARIGAKTYAAGMSSDKFRNELFARVDRLKYVAGIGMQSGNARGIAMAQLINQHLPNKTDLPDEMLDKLNMMQEGLADFQKSGYAMSPQLNKLTPPVSDGGAGSSSAATSTPATDAIKKRLAAKYGLH